LHSDNWSTRANSLFGGLNMRIGNTLRIFAGTVFVLFGVAPQAHAGLIEVETIEISSGIENWLQVAEVVALDMSGDDVALSSAGATADAPDSWNNNGCSIADRAIDGDTAGDWRDCQIYHEGNDFSQDTLTITLPSLTELMSIEIWGRTDCCWERDIYSVVFKDAQGNELYSIAQLDATGSREGVPGYASLPNTKVPEPGTLALLGAGLIGMGFARRRKKA